MGGRLSRAQPRAGTRDVDDSSPAAMVESDHTPSIDRDEAEALMQISADEFAKRTWIEVFDSRTPADPHASGNSRAPRLAVLAADLFRKLAATLNTSEKRNIVIKMFICPSPRQRTVEEFDANAPLAHHPDLSLRYVAIPKQMIDPEDDYVTGTTIGSSALIRYLETQLSCSAVDMEELLDDILRGEAMLSHAVVDFVPSTEGSSSSSDFSVAFLWKAPDMEQLTLWSVVITGVRR